MTKQGPVLHEHFPEPINLSDSVAKLKADLHNVPAITTGGRQTNVFDKLEALPDSVLRREQKDRVYSVLAEIRDAYLHINDQLPESERAHGYQMINWKHTCGELDQVIEAARSSGLTPNQTEDALLASIFSDCVKVPANFMTHNVHGAEGATEVLARYFDPSSPSDTERIRGIAMAVKEHQVAPPEFMARMCEYHISKNFAERGEEVSSADKDALARIVEKISKPFDFRNLTENLTEIKFEENEKQLLKLIGVEHWWVPHEGSSWNKASRAVIDGDSLINYASPDGWAKIVAIRGPGTTFEDHLIDHSLASVQKSYNDAFSVISPKAKPLARLGLARTELSVERVRHKIDKWLAASTPPRTDDGKIPFWDTELKYPGQDGFDQRHYEFAKTLKNRMVEMLREEQGMEPQWRPSDLAELSEKGIANLLKHLEISDHRFIQPRNINSFVERIEQVSDSWTTVGTAKVETEKRRQQLETAINSLCESMLFAQLRLTASRGDSFHYLFGLGMLEIGDEILSGATKLDLSDLYRAILASEQDACALLSFTDRVTKKDLLIRAYALSIGRSTDTVSNDWYDRVHVLDGSIRKSIGRGESPLFNYGRSEALADALQQESKAPISQRTTESLLLRTEIERNLAQHLVAKYLVEGDLAFSNLS